MKMKIILTAFLFFILFSLSCENDKNAPKWVNFYDPDKNEADVGEICGNFECGEIEYIGHKMICGECTEGKYCSKDQKCIEECGNNSCGTLNKQTYFGVKKIDCGKCEESEFCGVDNACYKMDAICYGKNCGKIIISDYFNNDIEVECGTCSNKEFCSKSLVCTLIESECIGKCGAISVATFEGDVEIECGGCDGEFAYCDTKNICKEACKEKECGTEKVYLHNKSQETFICGECEDESGYCGTDYKCKVACSGFECGVDNVTTFNGKADIFCGKCTNKDYCDSTNKCKTGIESGNFILDENIVIDTVNNLMWEKTNSQKMKLDPAENYCKNNETGGFKNWTLPNISMLKSIISGCKVSETCGITDDCTESTCANTDCDGCTNGAGEGPLGLYLIPDIWAYTGDAHGRFWSSSSTPDKADSYWFVRFSNGSVTFNWDESEYFVKCVRDLGN